jgi:hypothetical protein
MNSQSTISNVKVGTEHIFKPTIGNESLHEIINDNGVRVVNFATSKNLTGMAAQFAASLDGLSSRSYELTTDL